MKQRPLIIQKYGGMSLASPEHLRAAAKRVAALRASGYNVIAVVSAMGKTTDQLIQQAYSVSPHPNRRELDMLLSTGERVSMALFSMALTDALTDILKKSNSNPPIHSRAISFTGSQAGILTDETHSNARVIDVKPIRVNEELGRGNVVILAGFQGVSPTTKEITTLGRGGTDVTAVAMAIALGADRCEILKEVDGVLSADPKIVPDARLLPSLSHAHLLDMTFWGAKVLHYRSVELAAAKNVSLFIGQAHGPTPERGTRVMKSIGESEMSAFESESILAINSHSDVRRVVMRASSMTTALDAMESTLSAKQLPMPQLIDSIVSGSHFDFLITAPNESLEAQTMALRQSAACTIEDEKLATVTATCLGGHSSSLPARLSKALETAQVKPSRILISALSITFVVLQNQCDVAVRALHKLTGVR